MPTSRNHQGAHGIGQAEEQLAKQAEVSEALQGGCETDREVEAAARQDAEEYFDEKEE